jgi:tetratricopeptide (TPR) repeat protein
MKRQQTAKLLLTLTLAASPLLAAGCGQNEPAEAKTTAKTAAVPFRDEMRAAYQTFDRGDLQGAKARYQEYYEKTAGTGDIQQVRGAALGLARVHACLQEDEAAEGILEKLTRDELAAGLEGDLGTYWDSLASGLIYSAMGRTDKAEESFRRASRTLDVTRSPQSWVPAGKLAPRWFLARLYRDQGKIAEAEALELELAPALKPYQQGEDRYPGPVTGYLGLARRQFGVCGWDRQVAEVEGFFKAVGR